ncbi:MAG: DNA repair protein RecN [Vampirovibrionales bacterium]|nr:DNA repair protein RecN [Vampirovibrionales bacterium]
MLQRIQLTNIAIIDALDVSVPTGFTVITGETGSGKSILVESIALAFGRKVSPKEVLRTGTTKGSVELTFSAKHPAIGEILKAVQLESVLDDGPELVLTREFSETTSRYRLNGVAITGDVASQLQPWVVDLHGQHELTSLFKSDQHRHYLDCIGDDAHQGLRGQVAGLYKTWQQAQKAYDAYIAQREQVAQQRSFWEFQFQELNNAKLTDAEEDTRLKTQLDGLKQAEAAQSLLAELQALLHGDSDSGGLLPLSEAFRTTVGRLPNGVGDTLVTAATQLSQHIRDVSALSDGLERDIAPLEAAALDAAIERLDLLERLKRKHVKPLSALIDERDRLEKLLNQAEDDDADAELLQRKAAKAQHQFQALCSDLTQSRLVLAQRLTESVQGELADLALPHGRFSTALSVAMPSEQGLDAVGFQFSANPGEPLRPLQDVASGGELSRVLLALKVLLAGNAGVPTLVFDEIDTGISGPTARAVAERLYRLGQAVQVVCISHQPIVAAYGQTHWHVSKAFVNNSVSVGVAALTGDDRKRVLAQLASGVSFHTPNDTDKNPSSAALSVDWATFADALLAQAPMS